MRRVYATTNDGLPIPCKLLQLRRDKCWRSKKVGTESTQTYLHTYTIIHLGTWFRRVQGRWHVLHTWRNSQDHAAVRRIMLQSYEEHLCADCSLHVLPQVTHNAWSDRFLITRTKPEHHEMLLRNGTDSLRVVPSCSAQPEGTISCLQKQQTEAANRRSSYKSWRVWRALLPDAPMLTMFTVDGVFVNGS